MPILICNFYTNFSSHSEISTVARVWYDGDHHCSSSENSRQSISELSRFVHSQLASWVWSPQDKGLTITRLCHMMLETVTDRLMLTITQTKQRSKNCRKLLAWMACLGLSPEELQDSTASWHARMHAHTDGRTNRKHNDSSRQQRHKKLHQSTVLKGQSEVEKIDAPVQLATKLGSRINHKSATRCRSRRAPHARTDRQASWKHNAHNNETWLECQVSLTR